MDFLDISSLGATYRYDIKIEKKKRGSGSLMQNPFPYMLPPRSNKMNQEEPEEGEHLFHSHMWVKGASLHFIVDSESQNKLISAKAIKWLEFPKHHIHNHTTSGGSTKDNISA
jgi:hypothetical protein